ncbi:MAG TPA: HAMP domain-containing sensor histidine kinase [Kofleriaceae bacterium]|nr:HAMP domain-containing sensor histidine kinase [Kofleriaceae bacterium]
MPTSRDAQAAIVRAAGLDAGERAQLLALATRLGDDLPVIAARAGLSDPPAVACGAAWLAKILRDPSGERALPAWHVALKLPALGVLGVIHGARDRLVERAPGAARALHKLFDLETALLVHHVAHASQHQLVERADAAQTDRVAAIQTLSAGLAHEVRNPLNSAKLQLELLARRLRRDHDDPRLREPVELVHQEIERLTRLLNEFLAFARPSALVLGDHDVVAIARGVVEAEPPLPGITLTLAGSPAVPARVDAHQVHQIVHNLVRNAVEAVAAGGAGTVTVTVTPGDDADHVRIVVADDGPGIPEAVQHRIFEPFFSTKLSGTGLGLSIVHSAVALHGGTVRVDSSPRGTRFEVVLPRHAT